MLTVNILTEEGISRRNVQNFNMWVIGIAVLVYCFTVNGNEECTPGTFGPDCNQNCSENCRIPQNIELLCNTEDGTCYGGCNIGFYGDRCNQRCSKNCEGHVCYQINGHCNKGCIDNHIGDFCEIILDTTTDVPASVTTNVVPPRRTNSETVAIAVIVPVLVVLVPVVAVCIILTRRRKRKQHENSENDPEVRQGFFQARSETEAPRPGPTQMSDVPATTRDTRKSGTPSRPDTRATPTPALRDARADADLRVACWWGKLVEVKRILDTGRADVNSGDEGGMTPVMRAAWRGHRDVVELLVSRGADVSLVDDGGNNIPHWACVGGDRETVEFVLSLDGVDVNSRVGVGMTPVMWAAHGGHRDVVELLVSRGADVSLVDGVGNNILHLACVRGDRETVEFVLSLDGVDVNARNNKGQTAADVARFCGHRQLSDLLVSRGTQ